MKNPALTQPGLRDALLAIGKFTEDRGVPRITLELVQVRIGQINGCSGCVDIHCRALRKLGESDARIHSIATWRDASYYTEPERAALALAEAATRLSDRADAVPDDVWKEAAAHFDETALGALLVQVGVTNLWNRLNVSTRQVTGDWVAQYI